MNRLSVLAIAFAALPLAHAADLQVSAREVGEKGIVYFALFDQGSFLGTPIATSRSEPAMPSISFKGLAPGKYALIVYQDLNGNGQLDRNLVGAPTEPYGFSNDARGKMGPPNFDAAAVRVGAEDRSIVVTLH